MDLEVLILHYYLKVFSIILTLFLILCFFNIYFLLNKNIEIKNNVISIKKGDTLTVVLNDNINNFSQYDIFLVIHFYKLKNYLFKEFIHFGKFYIDDDILLLDFLNIIFKPSNIVNKLTIIEGWSTYELNRELSKHFDKIFDIPYEEIIADTYYYTNDKSFLQFVENLKKTKFDYFNKFKDNKIFENFSQRQLMIIGSLIEKEGYNYNDKKLISSVIKNRLIRKMRLQIDATVLYALTDGKYNLERKLFLKDLKINHPYNTYKIDGLPPKPISYVGKKTLDILLENHESDFMFYFFNNSLKRHIFSENYKNHIKKLNEYRNTK